MMENKPDIVRQLLSSSQEFRTAGGGDRETALIEKYIELLEKWNRKINLTSFSSPEMILKNLILNSLPGLHLVSPEGRLLDIGTGAGVPGFIIKFFRPEVSLTMIEARRKKCVFLETVIRELDLSSSNVLNCTFDEKEASALAKDGAFEYIFLKAVRIDESMIKALSLVSGSGTLLLLHSALSAQERRILKDYSFNEIFTARLPEKKKQSVTVFEKD